MEDLWAWRFIINSHVDWVMLAVIPLYLFSGELIGQTVGRLLKGRPARRPMR